MGCEGSTEGIFLFGQPHGGGFFLLIIRGDEASRLWIGVVCVGVVGRMLIISGFIVYGLPGYGVMLLDPLESLGSYLRGWLIYWLNGGIGSGSTRRIFGIWYCIV